jgi:sterol desaturase/sphingolipid hydroxylase (fatty acid hydroxylase superfamily)
VFWFLLSVFAFVGVAEAFMPLRRDQTFWSRWRVNLSLLLATQCLLALLPLSLVGIATWARSNHFGLLNQVADNPSLGANVALAILSFLMFDMLGYALHRLMHTDRLWRIHRLHHADLSLDWSTSFRHHPLELLVSFVFYAPLVIALGISPEVIAASATVGLAWGTVSHANIEAPAWLGPRSFQLFSLIVITPTAHWVHHSSRFDESNSNFGNFLSVWDWIFGSFRLSPNEPRKEMTLGLGSEGQETNIMGALMMPFRP